MVHGGHSAVVLKWSRTTPHRILGIPTAFLRITPGRRVARRWCGEPRWPGPRVLLYPSTCNQIRLQWSPPVDGPSFVSVEGKNNIGLGGVDKSVSVKSRNGEFGSSCGRQIARSWLGEVSPPLRHSREGGSPPRSLAVSVPNTTKSFECKPQAKIRVLKFLQRSHRWPGWAPACAGVTSCGEVGGSDHRWSVGDSC